MKRFLQIIALMLVAAQAGCASIDNMKTGEAESVTPVFILAGQSNMSGQSKVADAPRTHYPLPKNVTLYDYTQVLDRKGFRAWSASDEPEPEDDFISRRNPGSFGPELGFAHAIADQYAGREVVIIKWSLGGTGIDEWSPSWKAENFPDRSRNSVIGSLFGKSIGAAKAVKISGSYEYKALIWVQGENDALFPEKAKSYGEKLTKLIEGYRRELNTPDLQVIIGKIDPVSQKHKYVSGVQSGMEAVASVDEKVVTVMIGDLSKARDGIHYSPKGTLALGERLGAAWLASQGHVQP